MRRLYLTSIRLRQVPWLIEVFISLMIGLISQTSTATTLITASGVGVRDQALWVDPTAQATLADILGRAPEDFRPLAGSNLSAGYGRSAYWLRFTLQAPAGEWWLEIQPPILDDLRLYTPEPQAPGTFSERRAGDLLPYSARDVPYRGFVFKLILDDDQPRTYYLRLTTTSTIVLIPRLWSPTDFFATVTWETGLLFTNLGVIIAVLLLNLNNIFWLRDPLSPRFSLYVAMLFLYFAGNWGFVSQYLLPAAPALANPWPGISALLAIATGNCFYQHLFGIDHHHPFLLWLYRTLTWLALAAIPLIPLGYQPEVMPIIIQLTLMMTLIGLWLSYRRWRQREAGGVLVFLANLISLGNIPVILLAVLGWIPAGLGQFYSVNLAALGVILTLHLSLGSRHRAQREAQCLALAEVARERQVREQQGRFIDLLSHEYRTPLAVLQTSVDTLELGVEAINREVLSDMRQAIERLRHLFISAQRNRYGEANREALEMVPLDPEPLLRRILAQQQKADHRHGYLLKLETAGPRFIQADVSLLHIILGNLLENASKYATPDTPVELILDGGTEGISLSIHNAYDSAVGMDGGHLLQCHSRGANSIGQPGLGMGLYLAERLSADLGGALRLDLNQPGRFRVILSFPALELKGHSRLLQR